MTLIYRDHKTEEIWRDIPGYEGYYQVSNIGNIKSLDRYIERKTGVIQFTKSVKLKPFNSNASPHLQVTLCKKNTGKKLLIHRLVAKCFMEKWDDRLEVNHVDGNKLNNRADNLEMCSRHRNINHSIENNLKNDYGENSVNAKLSNWDALRIRNLHNYGIRQNDLAKMFGVCKQTICDIIHYKKYLK